MFYCIRMITEHDDEFPTKKTIGDAGHAIARAGLSALPLVGGPAVELFQNLVTPPLDKRRVEWMQEIGERLHKLETEGRIRIDDLREDPVFIDTVMMASQAALRTSQAEKKAALRNAILNSALPNAPEVSRRQMFVDLIESLTEWHLRLLKVFQDPAAWFKSNPATPFNVSFGGLSTVVEHAVPGLRGKREFYDQLWRELHANGLVNTDGLHTTMTGDGLMAKRTTAHGDAFIKFISDPN